MLIKVTGRNIQLVYVVDCPTIYCFQLQSGMAVKNGKIKTESGAFIKKSYKKNLYAEWKDKTKHDEQDYAGDEEPQFRKGKYPVLF